MIALRQALERARRRRIVGVVCVALLVVLILLVSVHLGEDAQHVSSAACLAVMVGLLLAMRSTAPVVSIAIFPAWGAAPRPPPPVEACTTPPLRAPFLPLLL